MIVSVSKKDNTKLKFQILIQSLLTKPTLQFSNKHFDRIHLAYDNVIGDKSKYPEYVFAATSAESANNVSSLIAIHQLQRGFKVIKYDTAK